MDLHIHLPGWGEKNTAVSNGHSRKNLVDLLCTKISLYHGEKYPDPLSEITVRSFLTANMGNGKGQSVGKGIEELRTVLFVAMFWIR